MRIVIDLQACQNGSRLRGIGRYAMAVTRAMIALDRGHAFHIMLSDAFPDTITPIREALADLLPASHIHICAMPGGSASANPANAWRTRAAELVRAQFIDGLAPDLLFVPSLFEGYHDAMVTSVERGAYRTAITLFDFIPVEYPRHYLPQEGIRRAYQRKLAFASAADLLLPISHYVAAEAPRWLGPGDTRLTAVPLGVEAMFRPPPPGAIDRAALTARYAIDRPFVLNTSPLEHRKNIPGLIAGFAALPRSLRDRHQLVIVGRMDDRARGTIEGLARGAGLARDAVVLAGFVPDEDLVALYSQCALFTFPSISEGFGLPVLEAMACGAPVVGSATTSIPEVIGREDLLFDPADPQAIAVAMARVLDDPGLQETLRRFGPERAAGFTWEATAVATLDAFEALDPPAALPARTEHAPPGRIVLVVPTMADGEVAAHVSALLPALGLPGEITLVHGDGGSVDPRIAANCEVRDFAWFERHAPRFAAPIYYAGAGPIAPMRDLMDMYPGLLLLHDETHDPDERGTAHVVVAVGADAKAEAASLRAAIARCEATGTSDPARRLAARLPRAVMDVRPSSDDLAAVARALAYNERVLDLTGCPR